MLPLLQDNLVLDRAALPARDLHGLYVHVPFCFHKCHYCDFYSITRQTPERMERFVDLVLSEAKAWADVRPVSPRTVFFGGGTPSLLPKDQMRRLITGLRQTFDLSNVNEWTIECNPATVDEAYCAMLRQAGVDRLSFGAQSFDPKELKLLERHHDPQDVRNSLRIARLAGFSRLNVDLIYAIPGQDLDNWLRSLEEALALETTHLSCYGLTYESNTPMTVRKNLGEFRAIDESIELQMLHATRDRLGRAGLHAYEVSNYATPGEECRHNLVYWNGENYLGLGPSAASHIEGVRWKNRPHLGEWETAVAADQLPAVDVETLSPTRRAGELVYLQLRLTRGVRFDEFAERTGRDARADYADQLARFSREGLLDVDESGFRVTSKGLNVVDAIAVEFLGT